MNNDLNEATAKITMSPLEKKWWAKIIKLLRDDGKGHHHNAYADHLQDYILNIIPAKDNPGFTAAISSVDPIIRISSGFLTDETTFYQLNVLLRHELAHNLMMHQIRMIKKLTSKYGEAKQKRISASMSMHDLMNAIEDMEIHNERMTEEDKNIIRSMWLNGETIGGLLAEDSPLSSTWTNSSVEQMYDALEAVTKQIQTQILSNWDDTNFNTVDPRFYDKEGGYKVDQIAANVNNALFYNNIKTQTNFLGPIDKFLDNKALYHFFPMDNKTSRGVTPALFLHSSLPEEWQDIIKCIFNVFTANTLTKKYCRDTIKAIAKTGVMEDYDFVDPKTGEILCTIITPEEKLVAIDTLKAILPTLESYQTWYDKVQRVLSDKKYSKEDIEKIINSL